MSGKERIFIVTRRFFVGAGALSVAGVLANCGSPPTRQSKPSVSREPSVRLAEREILVDSTTPITFPGGGIQKAAEGIRFVAKPETMSQLLRDPNVGINLPPNYLSFVFFYGSTTLLGDSKIDVIRTTFVEQIERIKTRYEIEQGQSPNNMHVSPNLVTVDNLVMQARGNLSAKTNEQFRDLLGALISLGWAEAANEAVTKDLKREYKPLSATARNIVIQNRPIRLA